MDSVNSWAISSMPSTHYALIAPCLNEGDVAVAFLEETMRALAQLAGQWTIVLVDDGSTDDTLRKLSAITAPPEMDLVILALPYTMGHQKAIQQGLLFAATTKAERFIVMDADGEDDPAAIQEMLQLPDASIILVARGTRFGPGWFRFGYVLYREFFHLITGTRFAFGNYSMIDRRALAAVLNGSFVHYAAFLSKQRCLIRTITSNRRKRIDGKSKMDLLSLTDHAFRSLVEYSEEVIAFFLKAVIGISILFILSIGWVVSIKLFTDLAIPGWASTLCLSLFNSVLLCSGFFALGLLLVHTTRVRSTSDKPLFTVVRGVNQDELPRH